MKITTRVAPIGGMNEQDQRTFTDWVWKARDINCFDPDVLSYPRTVMLTADDEQGPVLYLPAQPVLMLESLAPKPELSPRKEALALYKLGQLLEQVSADTGIKETYFLCKDARVTELCARHGFEKMEGYSVLKKKSNVAEYLEEHTCL